MKTTNSLSVYPFGCYMPPPKVDLSGTVFDIHKRGCITSFSKKSSARLRHFFLSNDIPSSFHYALTLTLPWSDDLFQCPSSDGWTCFRKLLNNLQVSYRRSFPRNAYVWRVELQERGVPHLHCVEYSTSTAQLGILWKCLVIKSPNTDPAKVSSFLTYGVKVDPLSRDNTGFYRYIIDHTTKHKKSQLGYCGRQWAIVNRKLFQSLPSLNISLTPDQKILFFRYLRRFNRYPITREGKIIKYRQVKRTYGVSFLRGGSDSVKKLLSLARANAAWPIEDTGRHADAIYSIS